MVTPMHLDMFLLKMMIVENVNIIISSSRETEQTRPALTTLTGALNTREWRNHGTGIVVVIVKMLMPRPRERTASA